MLSIISTADPEDIRVQDSNYVPFIAAFEGQKVSIPIYWRIGNFKDTLLEIAINPANGCISEVCIVMLKTILTTSDDKLGELSVKKYLPIVDVTDWPEDRLLDVELDFSVYGGDNFLRVLFSEKEEIKKIYRSLSVDFLVGDNEKLVGIEFSNVDLKDINVN